MEPLTEAVLKRTLHVISDSDGFALIEGEIRDVCRLFATKEQALQEARRLAVERGVEVMVHGADGSVQERELFYR